MVEKNQEVKYKAEVNKSKNPAMIIFALIVVTFIFGIGITIKSCKTETATSQNTGPVSLTKKWSLYWQDTEETRHGTVKSISFRGSNVEKMVILFSTGVTVKFFQKNGFGIWTQPGDKGIWSLHQTKTGMYIGETSDHRGWKAKLVLF